MASSFTSPGLILASNQAIMEAQRAVALARLFSTDFSAELQGVGKTLSVPVFSGGATVFDEASNDYETTDGSIVPVRVSLDTVVKVTYSLDQKDLLELDRSSTARNCGIAGGRAIARKIEELILSKLDCANRAAAVASFTVAKLGKALAEAEKAGIDPATCVVILDPDAYGDLLDANAANAAIRGDDIAGSLGRKYGCKAIVSSAKVSNVSTAKNGDTAAVTKGAGFIVPDAAIAVAGRGIEQAAAGLYQEYGTQSDEGSGLTVTAFGHGTPGKNRRFMNVAALLGVALTRTASNGAPGYLQLVRA